MKCSEKVLQSLTVVGEDTTLNDEVAERVNKLSDTQCKKLCAWVEIEYLPHQDLSVFVSNWLGEIERDEVEIEKGRVEKELQVVKSAPERARSGKHLSKKEVADMLGVSESQIDKWLRQDNPIPSIQLKKGGAVTFLWKEVEQWVFANNIR